eukprot:1381439-Rhodomonas_salina.1
MARKTWRTVERSFGVMVFITRSRKWSALLTDLNINTRVWGHGFDVPTEGTTGDHAWKGSSGKDNGFSGDIVVSATMSCPVSELAPAVALGTTSIESCS